MEIFHVGVSAEDFIVKGGKKIFSLISCGQNNINDLLITDINRLMSNSSRGQYSIIN